MHVDNGCLDTFKCTYHGWEYNTEGVLTHLQDAEDFDGGNPCGKIKLKEVHCEVSLGFVWVSLADKPQKFEEMGRLSKPFEYYSQVLQFSADCGNLIHKEIMGFIAQVR